MAFFAVLILSGCLAPRHVRKGPYFLKPFTDGIALNDTLWYDRSDVSNVDWQEYLFWLERVYGREHERYLAALPDTTEWTRKHGSVICGEPKMDGGIYFRHPAYHDYPIIGVSRQQTEDYSVWRSDRVYEALLVRNGVIEYNRSQDPENHFTIARYQRGDFETFELPDKYLWYPVYRLPDSVEQGLILKLALPPAIADAPQGFRNVMSWRLFLHDSIIGEPVTDIDGNTYRTVRHGGLVWMAENLMVTRLNDGTEISLLQEDSLWASATTPAYSWNLNLEAWPRSITGAYYNRYAVETGKLCPAGWRVPSTDDWESFSSIYGGQAGGAMKVPGYTWWVAPNPSATNIAGFSAYPAGHRVAQGEFYPVGLHAFWWSTTPQNDRFYYSFALTGRRQDFRWMLAEKHFGLNVRCVREE